MPFKGNYTRMEVLYTYIMCEVFHVHASLLQHNHINLHYFLRISIWFIVEMLTQSGMRKKVLQHEYLDSGMVLQFYAEAIFEYEVNTLPRFHSKLHQLLSIAFESRKLE